MKTGAYKILRFSFLWADGLVFQHGGDGIVVRHVGTAFVLLGNALETEAAVESLVEDVVYARGAVYLTPVVPGDRKSVV